MPFTYEHPRPALTADVVALAAIDGRLRVLLVQRAAPPFRHRWALPGGFVDIDERVEHAARRELAEETGVRARKLLQLGVYDRPNRDPRGRTISVAYLALFPQPPAAQAASDAAALGWHALSRPPRLAFDHADILRDARARLRLLAAHPTDLLALLPPRTPPTLAHTLARTLTHTLARTITHIPTKRTPRPRTTRRP